MYGNFGKIKAAYFNGHGDVLLATFIIAYAIFVLNEAPAGLHIEGLINIEILE